MSQRELSFWGWGWADRFPDEDVRRGLAAQMTAMFGEASAPELRAPPQLEAVTLAAPRLPPPPALAAFCSAAPRQRVTHTYGRSFRDIVRGFAGDFAAAPDFVARPRREVDVEAVLSWAEARGVAVIPFGGGTSVVGGVEGGPALRHNGVVSLDLRGLDGVLEVDAVSRAARIQAGATGPAIEAQLAPHGFTLRHYPQSFEHSTLGGWLATRAGGHFATLYTHIDELTQSIRMLTPRGWWESRRLPASGAGPSPDRLALGSEGTLGVITEAWVRLQAPPRFRAKATVRFSEWTAAVEAVRQVAQAGLYPTNCRLLEAREAMLNGVASDGKHLLLLAFESADHPLQAWIERALAIAVAAGGECPEGAACSVDGEGSHTAATWKAAFFAAPYLQSALISLGVIADTFETACTWAAFPQLHAAVVQEVGATLRRVCGAGLVTCRFTHVYPDGPAPYFTFLAPGRCGAELEQWAEVKQAAGDALLRHGGTITHHHAVGRTHRPWYDRQRPEPFAAALRAIKRELDPAGILNPGVLLDP